MSSTPPESGPGFPGAPPGQFGYQGGQQGMRRPRRMGTARIICGIIWAVLTVILGAGFFAELSIHIVGGAVLCLVFAIGCGWYDYRVWTFKARRLWFII